MSKFTAKQQLFIQHYAQTLNATEAAKRAGYSENSARCTGWENLQKPDIKKAIQEEIENQLAEYDLNKDGVIRELGLLAMSDMADFAEWGAEGYSIKDSKQLGRAKTRAVQAVKFKTIKAPDGTVTYEHDISLHNKVQALDKLGRAFGAYEEDNKQVNDTDFRQELLERLTAKAVTGRDSGGGGEPNA